MAHYIDKDALVAGIEKIIPSEPFPKTSETLHGAEVYGKREMCFKILDLIDTLEVKEVDLIIHTIIAECCNWLAVHTELNHEQIEDCRNLMLTVKDEQLKAKQG